MTEQNGLHPGEAAVAETLRRAWTESGERFDPHTAVALACARLAGLGGQGALTRQIVLSTAHGPSSLRRWPPPAR